MPKRDERRFRRVRLNLPVQITVNTIDIYNGELINISPGGLAVIVDANVSAGDAVNVAISGLDEIEGMVSRTFPDGFALSYRLSKKRRAALTEQILLKSHPEYAKGLTDRRNSLRHRDLRSRTACRLADGTSLYVKIIDRSVDGISVEASRKPAIGSEITIGRRQGAVVRHSARGFVVVFRSELSAPTERILRVV